MSAVMSVSKAPRIVLIHAVRVAMEPILQAFASAWPEAELINLLDESLGVDRAKDVELTAELHERIIALGRHAFAAGADAILYTCSAFTPAIDAVARLLPIPVLKPDEAMFEAALRRGGRIGLVATFAPAVASTEAEFRKQASAAGLRTALTTVVVPEAMAALRAGDVEAHNRLVAAAAAGMAEQDAIMLAHFSTSRAGPTCTSLVTCPVITSPQAAVSKIKRMVLQACAPSPTEKGA